MNKISPYLTSPDPLTQQIRQMGISSWDELVDFVKHLPYGRNLNREDLSLVISESKGTCSSKHALLKKVADLNAIANVKLILCLYKMSTINTPKIGMALEKRGIDYIPEAHCYLMVGSTRTDITTEQSEFQKIKNDIILEKEILPEQVADFKVEFHQSFLKQWIHKNRMAISFSELWKLREQCIQNLSVS